MDGDSKKQNKIQNSFRDRGIDARNLLQSIRFRCPICVHNEIDRFLLDYGCYFLPSISFVIYCILFIKETL